MRNTIVLTSNIMKFLQALTALQKRGVGEEGMGLLSGLPGEGKSTTIAYVVNTRGGVYLPWSLEGLRQAICFQFAGAYLALATALLGDKAAMAFTVAVDDAIDVFADRDLRPPQE